MRTFGEVIAEARKKANLAQRQLAARIKTEEGKAISGPYLNDIEHNLRHPPRGYLLEQFAKELHLDVDLLYFLPGKSRLILIPTRSRKNRRWPRTGPYGASSRAKEESDDSLVTGPDRPVASGSRFRGDRASENVAVDASLGSVGVDESDAAHQEGFKKIVGEMNLPLQRSIPTPSPLRAPNPSEVTKAPVFGPLDVRILPCPALYIIICVRLDF